MKVPPRRMLFALDRRLSPPSRGIVRVALDRLSTGRNAGSREGGRGWLGEWMEAFGLWAAALPPADAESE